MSHVYVHDPDTGGCGCSQCKHDAGAEYGHGASSSSSWSPTVQPNAQTVSDYTALLTGRSWAGQTVTGTPA
ncbi:MAG: hypothetical protein AAFR55_01465, partial [Pseudomonadota bacterium]